jgi:hypothetical protein
MPVSAPVIRTTGLLMLQYLQGTVSPGGLPHIRSCHTSEPVTRALLAHGLLRLTPI